MLHKALNFHVQELLETKTEVVHWLQARSQDRIWGGAEPPKGGPFGPKKWTFLNLTPSTLLQKPHFWPNLWPKVDLLPDLGGASHPLAMGLIG